jgi:hypothetical protein
MRVPLVQPLIARERVDDDPPDAALMSRLIDKRVDIGGELVKGMD